MFVIDPAQYTVLDFLDKKDSYSASSGFFNRGPRE